MFHSFIHLFIYLQDGVKSNPLVFRYTDDIILQQLTFKLTGQIGGADSLTLEETKSYNAEVIAIPVKFKEYNSDTLLAMMMQKVNDKLRNIKDANN